MISLNRAQQIINDEIKKIEFPLTPSELYEPIKYILRIGGKRIRPALTLLSCSLFSENISPAINPALALEIFHNFTLVHDDIMDNAFMRRNQQTIHKKWNNNIAILSGDTMCIKAYEYINKCDKHFLKQVVEEFNKVAIKVCEGQQYDMNFEIQKNVTEEEYLKMIELKTSVLFAACLKIGAITGGAADKDAGFLYNFGLNLGMAFQLQDDFLDVFSDENTLGKEIGKDIISNKKTYLLIKAMGMAKGAQIETLKKWITVKNFDQDEKIKSVKAIYLDLGINKITLKTIESYFNSALEELNKVNVNDERKSELKKFLFNIKNRKN